MLPNNQDLLPTLIDLCGLPTPKSAKFDGTSLAGLLNGTADKSAGPHARGAVREQPNGRAREMGLGRDVEQVAAGSRQGIVRPRAAIPGRRPTSPPTHPDVVKKLRDHYDEMVGRDRADA